MSREENTADVMRLLENLKLCVETEFTVTLEGVYQHISPERVRILDRIARFHTGPTPRHAT